MGITFGKITRDHRLPWLAFAIALYRHRQSNTKSIFSSIGDSFKGSSSFKRFVGDIVGVYLVIFVARKFINLRRGIRTTNFQTLKDCIGNELVKVLKIVPGTKKRIDKEFKTIQESLENSLKDENREKQYVLPKIGLEHPTIVDKLTGYYQKEKSLWQDGWASGAVYHGGDKHLALQAECLRLFSITNPLHPDMWPSVMKFEAEIVAMTASILNGKKNEVCGTLSSGGTESIILSARAHRQWGAEVMGITRPEIVAPQTAHAAIDKACEMLGIKLVQVPVSNKTFKVNPKTLEKYITSDTVMIFASAPQFPHGVIDPIEELSQLAVKYGVGLHVDCCLGGFFLPFVRKLGYDVPKFDFELPGVTSMSCDTHKYGYAVKGTSVILYKNHSMRHYQYFTFPNWPGGLYATPSTPGSRPGALIAACWASLVAMGENGFLDATRRIIETQRLIKRAVCDIDGVELCGDPMMMIVAIQSKVFNIYNLSEKMHKKGWTLNALQNPPCVHICITMRTVEANAGERFCNDLSECVRECLDNPNDEEKGAAMYGMASSMPAGPVCDMMRIYNDVVLAV